MAFCNRPKGSTARAVLLACAVAGFGFCLVAGPAWSPARGDVDLLVDGEGTFVADSQPNDSDSTIAESGRAGPLLNQIRRALTGGDSDRVLYLLEQLHKMGPEVVIRETGRGVHQSLGDMVYGFPAEMRKKWADFVGPHAEAALDLAHRAGGADGYVRVVRSFPGTPAARRAAGQLYGLAFENGRFRRTVELVRALLADPGLTAERRRTALLVLAISAVEVGDRPSVAEALERLKKLGRGKPVPLLGSDVEAIAFVEKLSKRRPEIEPLWLNVGGAFTRNRLADSEPTFEGLLVMGGTDSLGASTWASGVLPARKQLLEKQERKVSAGWTEGPVLVTERSFIAGRGSRLVAYDRLSGDRLWQLSLSPEGLMNVMTSWPSAADGKVATVASWYRSVDQRPFGRLQARRPGYLMRTERKKLVVLSEETGQEIWSWDGSLPMPSDPETGQASPGADLQPADDPADRLGLEPAGSPLVYGGRVFVGAVHKQHRQILVNCFVMCFEASNGRLLWQRFIGSGAVASLPQGGDATKRMVPTTDGRRLYVESAVGTLAAIDLATADLVWVRKFARPSAPNRMGLIPASWPSGLGDAPIVVGSRLLVSDISSPQFQTQLRCFDTATGRDLWKGVEMQPGQRLGVAQGMLLVSSGRSLYGYDVADGQRRLLVGLPGGAQVTGRGFLTAGAAYVPTDAGIFRIDLKERKATLAYARQEGTEPSLALTPVGGGVVSNHPDQLRVFGRIDEYFERVRRGIAAHPDDPVWTRRLAELCRQGNDFSKAELLLQLAADQA
ncbi:MAG: PQQ-binding-like beta-propeller repeat protein, partial [Anaerolineaceae bacterium]|nr:PQQ-binding-like beta-propeller repeat protein [Anaerolineaceae bacterium]